MSYARLAFTGILLGALLLGVDRAAGEAAAEATVRGPVEAPPEVEPSTPEATPEPGPSPEPVLAPESKDESASDPYEGLTRINGTHVWVPKPDDFVQAQFGTALIFPNGSARIQVAEFARPYAKTIPGYSEAVTASLNVTLRKQVQIGEYEGTFLRVSGRRDTTGTSRWLAIFGDETFSVVITAVGPSLYEEVFDVVYRRALLGAQFNPRARVNPYESLPFFVAGKSMFRFANRLQSTLMFTLHGKLAREGPDDPLLIASLQEAAVDGEDQLDLCAKSVEATPNLKSIELVSSGPFEADGMPGCEALARAVDEKTGRPMLLYEAHLYEQRRYYSLKGVAGVRFRQKYVTEFARVARQIRRR